MESVRSLDRICADIGGRGGAGVCVIIAAYNCRATIGRAIASALAEPEVIEVVVVDDASTDDTAEVAADCEDGTQRLQIIRLARNGGPGRARNEAIKASSAPYVAILDADDLFLPGRFETLLEGSDWDLVADNIAMISEDELPDLIEDQVRRHRIRPISLNAAAFVEGCITRRGRYRGELAFLKPVFRRSFLKKHGLAYDEEMRLAEDFDLYVRALCAGARFRIKQDCRYIAIERANSLSSQHSIADLARMESSVGRMIEVAPASDPMLQSALKRHHRQVGRRLRHRIALDSRRRRGVARTLFEQLRHPVHMIGVLVDVLGDKIGGLRRVARKRAQPTLRFLLNE